MNMRESDLPNLGQKTGHRTNKRSVCEIYTACQSNGVCAVDSNAADESVMISIDAKMPRCRKVVQIRNLYGACCSYAALWYEATDRVDARPCKNPRTGFVQADYLPQPTHTIIPSRKTTIQIRTKPVRV